MSNQIMNDIPPEVRKAVESKDPEKFLALSPDLLVKSLDVLRERLTTQTEQEVLDLSGPETKELLQRLLFAAIPKTTGQALGTLAVVGAGVAGATLLTSAGLTFSAVAIPVAAGITIAFISNAVINDRDAVVKLGTQLKDKIRGLFPKREEKPLQLSPSDTPIPQEN